MKARTDQAHTVIIGEARSPVGVSLGLRLIGDEEVATVTLSQHDRTVTLYVTGQAHAAQIAAAIQGHPPLAAPAAQGEPVAWQVINIKYPKVEPATHNRYPDWAEGDHDLKINPLYATPQPAEQQPIKPSLAFDASVHLSNWLNMNLCECEGGHTCGYNDVKRTRDALLAAAEQQPEPDVAGLVEALESLIKGYVRLLEAGMDRITSLGGHCDPVPVMEQNDPWLRDARAALAAHRKQGGDQS